MNRRHPFSLARCRRAATALLLLTLNSCVTAQRATPSSPEPVVRPEARVQTVEVPSGGDAADDPAIWIHPRDAARSLVLGTDKQGALFTYNLDGSIHQVVAAGAQPNNVDVLHGFPLGTNSVDLALAAVRRERAQGVKVWAIHAGTRELTDVTAGGVMPVLGGNEPYGSCTYRSAVSGRAYFFVTSKDGAVEQHELADAGEGRITARRVRTLKVGSISEGCVADDELGVFYLSEEAVGIWKFNAEPDGATEGVLIARVGEHGLQADVEGLTLYYATGGRGYLIASSQGNNTFKVYDRQPGNRFRLTIDPRGGKIDDVNDTDGICVSSAAAGALFPKGLFVVQDGTGAGGRQNFKFYGWEDIAGTNLLIEPRPRR